jgi:hypothetical protein
MDQARGEHGAEVQVALPRAGADEVMARVQRLQEVVERDRVPEELPLARR